MEPWRIVVRVLAAYLYLAFTTRAAGKRVVAQATPFDLVVSLIVGDLIDDVFWAEVGVTKFGAAAGTIFICDALTKLAAFHSPRFLHLVNGVPRVVMRSGAVDDRALRREQLSRDDLEHLLRLDGIATEKWEEVHLATIERDHEASLILTRGAEPATRRDAPRAVELAK